MLIVSPHGSYRAVPFVVAAKQLGMEPVLASDGRYSIVSVHAEGLHVDWSRLDEALDLIHADCRRHGPLAGVVGTDDGSTELAARVAARLGLINNPVDAVRIARRKDLARARLSSRGVRGPGYRQLDLRRPLGKQLQGLGYPCVVKPVALSASRGVIRADDVPQLLAACERIRGILTDVQDPIERNILLVEDFIPGAELAVEGVLYDGQFELLAIFDKPDSLNGPFFEETIYVTPSRQVHAAQQQIRRTITRACEAYGLREGPVHAECRVNSEGVWILELASRTIGGLCSRLFRFGTGFGLEHLVLTHAVGQHLSARRPQEAAGIMMLPIPQAGVLRRVEGVTAARRVPYVEDLTIEIREGYELVPLPEAATYLGFIFARGPTPAKVETALRQAHACLNIVVAPLWKPLTRIAG